MVGQSNGGEMREQHYENESMCHNQPVRINEGQKENVLDTLNLTQTLLQPI
jgi:hypothetical protein